MTAAIPAAARHGAAVSGIWWQSGKWAVTPYGLVEWDGFNAIPSDRLAEHRPDPEPGKAGAILAWPYRMAMAGLFDEGFADAFPVALALHGWGSVDPAIVVRSLARGRRQVKRLAYAAAHPPKLTRKQRAAAMVAAQAGQAAQAGCQAIACQSIIPINREGDLAMHRNTKHELYHERRHRLRHD